MLLINFNFSVFCFWQPYALVGPLVVLIAFSKKEVDNSVLIIIKQITSLNVGRYPIFFPPLHNIG